MTLYKLPKQYSPDFNSPSIKPTCPVEIDWDNPLTENLEFFTLLLGGGTHAELTRGAIQNNGTHETIVTIKGIAVKYTGSGNTQISAYPELDPSTDCAFACCYNYNGGTPSSFSRPFGRTANNGASDPFINWDFELWPLGVADRIAIQIFESGSIFRTVNIDVSGGLSVGHHTLIGNQANNVLTGHVDNQSGTVSSSPSGPNLTGGNDIYFGGFSPSGFQNISGSVLWGAFWSKSLNEAKIRELINNPYQLLKPKSPPLYFTPTGVAPSVSIPVIMNSYRQRRA